MTFTDTLRAALAALPADGTGEIHLDLAGQCRCLSSANPYRFVNRQPWVHDAGYASVDRVI
jgi:hypothetical protein